MQNALQSRQVIVRIDRAEPVRSSHLGTAAQRVVAKPEVASAAERRWRRQRLQPVQRVVHIARRATLRVGERCAVRCFVVCVARGEISGQERVAGRGPRQPSHVVKREAVCAGGVAHQRQARVEVVRVIHGRRIRIGLLRHPIQLVVGVGDLLVLPVRLDGQIVIRVVAVVLDVARRERRPRHSPEGVIREVCRVVVCVLDARQIVFGVVPVRGHVVGRVRDRQQPVRVVVRVRGRLPVLVVHRSPPPTRSS